MAFIAGSVLATFHMPFWWDTPSLGEISLAATFGWTEAVILQLAAFGMIAVATIWVERRRLGVPRPVILSVRGWRRLIHGPWPLLAGGVALAVLNALTLALAGHPWTITWAFTLWGGKTLQAVGYDLSALPFWRGEFQQAALAASIFADVTSVMDIGIVLGALLGAGLAGRFAPRRFPIRIVPVAILGGLLLGYGARIAYGCNIAAYFGGIASTSLHGWLWGAAAVLGTVVGVRLRRLFGVEQAPSC